MIKKFIILFLASIICNVSVAQKDSTNITTKNMRRLYFSVVYNPKIEFRDFENKTRSATLERGGVYYKTLSYSPKNEKITFEHSVGLSASIKIYQGLRFDLGISFNKNIYQTNLIDTAHIYIYHGALTQDENYNEINVYKLKREKTFFGLSPTIKYYFKFYKKWFVNIGVGMCLSRWQGEYFSYNASNNGWKSRSISTSSYEGLYTSAYTANVGICYLTKYKNLISMEPNFKYYKPSVQNPGFKRHFYYLGISLSFSI